MEAGDKMLSAGSPNPRTYDLKGDAYLVNPETGVHTNAGGIDKLCRISELFVI